MHLIEPVLNRVTLDVTLPNSHIPNFAITNGRTSKVFFRSAMASLARLCVSRRVSHRTVRLLPAFLWKFDHVVQLARGIQTSADTTQLHDKPSDLSQPLTLRLSEDSFQAYQCD